MTKLQKIYDFLTTLETGVFEKNKAQTVKRIEAEEKAKKTKKLTDLEYAKQLAEAQEHTRGQLYEIAYIIENFWEIIEEK